MSIAMDNSDVVIVGGGLAGLLELHCLVEVERQ